VEKSVKEDVMVAARNLTKAHEASPTSGEMVELQNLYEFINPAEIEAFLQRKPHLFKLLRDTRRKLDKFFPGAQVTLERFPDSRESHGDCQMSVMVYPPEEMQDVLVRIKKFNKNWDIKMSHQIKGDFCINYEHPTVDNSIDWMKKLIGTVEAPEDWSLESDHYRLGTPKRYS
jgi:hypothetical protein